jgi:hypothetical protein
MTKTTLVSLVAAGLALLPVSGALAATNPAALNPYPNRDSKLLVDFESTTMVTSDPMATGTSIASTNTDPQFVAEGSQSLKLDVTGLGGWYDHYFTVNLAGPVDIKGYQVLSMDVFVPDTSIDSSGYYQFDPRTTTVSPTDATMSVTSYYGPRNMHAGWNHLVWNLINGTDTQITQLDFAGNTDSSKPYSGPVYVDNIRVYKGNFVGLQPDEQLVFGFDNTTDPSLFTSGDGATITLNTDKQFISQGTGSLEVDMTGLASGWSNNVASATGLTSTLDLTKATALHLDIFSPTTSYTATDYHELGYTVIGTGGQVGGDSGGYVDGQWNALEIPLSADQAQSLGTITGIQLIRNSGSAWSGPVYIDDLRAVFPTTTTPATPSTTTPATGQ